MKNMIALLIGRDDFSGYEFKKSHIRIIFGNCSMDYTYQDMNRLYDANTNN